MFLYQNKNILPNSLKDMLTLEVKTKLKHEYLLLYLYRPFYTFNFVKIKLGKPSMGFLEFSILFISGHLI